MATNSAEGLPYKVQVAINGKYRPLILRGRLIHEQTPRFVFPEKLKAGEQTLTCGLMVRFIMPIHQANGQSSGM
jgi:hypothetical protein